MKNKIKTELEGKLFIKKRGNYSLIESYERLGYDRRAERIKSCATFLEYRTPTDNSDDPRLHRANFCKDRLCNVCAWRRSLKIFGQVSKVMDELQKEYAFVFLTLTVRNCSAPELSTTIDKLQKAFTKFIKSEKTTAFKGYFKAIEITHHNNYPTKIQYHPHIHAIIAVNKSYFTSRDYLSKDKIIKLWQEKLQTEYEPSVDIHKVKPQIDEKGEWSIKKAVCETAKYTVKTRTITQGTNEEIDRAVKAYTASLENRRVCSFGGVFKETANRLKLDDMIDGDLINTDNKKIRYDLEYIIESFEWRIGYGYIESGNYIKKPKED